jgi:hypothetical protein
MKFLWILILALLFAGCQAKQPPSSGTDTIGDPISAHGTDGAKPAEPVDLLKGRVLERLDAGRYSYLRLSTSSGEVWAAVLQAEVKVGQDVAVVSPMPMDGFESKTLNRTFDRIFFGVLDQPGGEDPAQILMDAHSGVADTASVGPIKVEKAAGSVGRTVVEIFSQKLELKDRKVAVRGKVIKVNANILDRTWIHIQDGTGDSQARTNDLTVTSKSSATVGDTVLIEGVVRTDKNYGMGYVFSVIIEDASITKQ